MTNPPSAPTSASLSTSTRDALEALAPGAVSSDPSLLDSHAVDWSREHAQLPALVLRPKTVDELSALLRYCNEEGLAVVVQGGMTGLSGGATPRPGELALSLARMSGVIELDKRSMTLTAWAGTPLQTLQQAAADAGLQLPLDLGARGSCTIGGNVSTNAGGNQVLSYGMTRALVLGLEAVLADGTVVSSLNKMLKNNAGYDLKHLFIGSEGTLGIVTRVVLRLYPVAQSKQTALCAFRSFAEAIDFLQLVQRHMPRVTAFELMWKNYIDTVFSLCEGLQDPFQQRYPFYVLVQCEGGNPEGDLAAFEQLLFAQMEAGTIVDGVIAQSETEAGDFWAIRDAVSELLATVKDRANFDIGVPINEMEACVDDISCELRAQYPDIQMPIFGHIADSNLHIIAWTPRAEEVEAIYLRVYQIVQRYGGTVTAEHGVGVMKIKYLQYCRSPQELALMHTMKQALDPNGILNAGRVVS